MLLSNLSGGVLLPLVLKLLDNITNRDLQEADAFFFGCL